MANSIAWRLLSDGVKLVGEMERYIFTLEGQLMTAKVKVTCPEGLARRSGEFQNDAHVALAVHREHMEDDR